jgi:transposase InsO family protein
MTGINRCKFYDWKKRAGQPNRHNGKIPKKHWLTPEERDAIIDYARSRIGDGTFFVNEGYRRLTYQMIDEDIVYCSPSSVYRVLKSEDMLNRWNTSKSSSKGNGYRQPEKPHMEWHTDIKHVNFKGTFLFLISVMDGYSRYIVHHELRANMTEYDVELTVQKALEKHPGEKPRIISDNGGQYISKDFKDYIKQAGLRHTRTSVAYPQSNGKIERFHRSIEDECIRKKSMISMKDAVNIMASYIEYYNNERLHSSLYFLTPKDYIEGTADDKLKARENKLNKGFEDRIRYWETQKGVG